MLKGDFKDALAGGKNSLLEIVAATHAGMTTEEFEKVVREWIATAKHPKTGRPYTEMVYLPMLELLGYLREHGFKTYIVSGGGVEFMRPWTEKVYGVPPEQVIGSTIKTRFEKRGGKPVLVRLPEVFFIDDGDGKPVAIQKDYWPTPAPRLRQLRRRSGDARVDRGRRRREVHGPRSSHRRLARVGLRPRVEIRTPRPGA